MKRFTEGEGRGQGTLLPEHLDDYVAENNPVRVIDVFVDELDLGRHGFERAQREKTGRPAYRPAVLLKLYIYGYLNRQPRILYPKLLDHYNLLRVTLRRRGALLFLREFLT